MLGGQYGLPYRIFCYFFHKERRYLWNEYIYHMRARKNGKTYVILRAPYSDTGLMSDIGYFMCLISYWSAKKNYIPVVDMKNYKSPYIKDEEIGKTDAWAYWFQELERMKRIQTEKLYCQGIITETFEKNRNLLLKL